jgi:hypothetical protein
MLSNVAFPSPIATNVISPLPTFITLKPSGPFHVFISLVRNLQTVASFDVTIPLFPSSVQPNFIGNIHVDSPTTSFENVVILNDLPNTESNLDLLLVYPP